MSQRAARWQAYRSALGDLAQTVERGRPTRPKPEPRTWSGKELRYARRYTRMLGRSFERRTVSPEEWLVLHRLARGRILEVGVHVWLSSTAFLSAMEHDPKITLLSCDIRFLDPGFRHPNPDIEQRWLRVEQSSHILLPSLLPPFDLVFIDGNHKLAFAESDIRQALRLGRTVAVHDCNYELGDLFLGIVQEHPERPPIRWYSDTMPCLKGLMVSGPPV